MAYQRKITPLSVAGRWLLDIFFCPDNMDVVEKEEPKMINMYLYISAARTVNNGAVDKRTSEPL